MASSGFTPEVPHPSDGGPQIWRQLCRWGLTRGRQRSRIPPSTAAHAMGSAQHMGASGRQCTWPGFVQLLIQPFSQAVLLLRAALNPSSTQPELLLGITTILVQHLTLGLAELHKAGTGPSLRPVQVPLHAIPSL